MRLINAFIVFVISSSLISCSVKKEKDIIYKGELPLRDNLLDIYYPRNKKGPKDVLVFIHGGSWSSGNKDIYWWLGSNFARKDIITVVLNYPLSPENTYNKMADNSAIAVKWVSKNIKNYNGNPEGIYLMGHSAGGHLAALIALDDKYIEQPENPVKGVILNDAFGLDIYQYLTDNKSKPYRNVFTNNPAVWKDASPQSHIKDNKLPFLIYTGENTYDTIKIQSSIFRDKLMENGARVDYREIKKKKHIGMITQMLFGWNKRYQEINAFIKRAE